MNIQEMHSRVDLLMDRTNSPRFRPTDKDNALNIAIERVIKDRYDNVKVQKRYSAQSAQRLRDELRTLVTEKIYVSSEINKDNDRISVVMPDDYRHELNMFVLVDNKSIVSRPTNYDELGPLLNSPFERPSFFRPVHLEIGNSTEFFIGAKGSLTQAKMTYIKNPVKVSLSPAVDSDMPENVHEEIVQIAASILSGTVMDSNRRTFLEQENGMS